MELIDPALYAGTRPKLEELPEGSVGSKLLAPVTETVAIGELLPPDHPDILRAEAAMEAASQPESTMWEGAKAAFATSDTGRILNSKWFMGSSEYWGTDNLFGVKADPGAFNAFMSGVDVPLTEHERDFVANAGATHDAWAGALVKVKHYQEAARIAGEHGAINFAMQALDPVQMVAIGATGGASWGLKAGRVASAAANAAIPFAVNEIADGPKRDLSELVKESVLYAGAGALTYNGGKLEKLHPDMPNEAIQDAVAKPHLKPVVTEREITEMVPQKPKAVRNADGTLTEVPQPDKAVTRTVVETTYVPSDRRLRPDSLGTTHEVAAAVDSSFKKDSGSIWSNMYWNQHAELAKYSRKVADEIADDNADLSKNSMESVKAGILTDLRQYEHGALDSMLAGMKERGMPLWRQITSPRQYSATQRQLMREVRLELDRQAKLFADDLPITAEGVDPTVFKIATQYNRASAAALREAKRIGVKGTEAVESYPGWYPRSWSAYNIGNTIDRLAARGVDGEKAVKKLVADAIYKASAMDREVAQDIGNSIINRALRKGEHIDANFISPGSIGDIAAMRDVLREEVAAGRMTPQRMERALDVLRNKQTEARKLGNLKHRTTLDMNHSMDVGGEPISVHDMIDDRIESGFHKYFERMAGEMAIHSKGFDVDAARREVVAGAAPAEKAKAAELFENMLANIRGTPMGGQQNSTLRALGAYTRAVSLGNAGFWQVAESATIAARYGVGKTLKHFAAEMPVFKKLLKPTQDEARTLKNVIEFNSAQSLRLKPLLYRFDDNFDMPMDSAVQLQAQAVNQLVPYVNGMAYIHKVQASMAAGLIVDRLEQAAKWHAGAREMLAKYGLKAPVMDRLAVQFEKHGNLVDEWDAEVWRDVSTTTMKMMDEAVMKARMGDIPAFVQYDNVGKFIWTYRGFVLAAHNKLFVGGLDRNGLGATGLMMMYQIPLAALAVSAVNASSGKSMTDKQIVAAVGGQLSSLGLLTEAGKVLSGNMDQFGSPALIATDRALKLAGSLHEGDAGKSLNKAMDLIPLYRAVPFSKQVNNLVTGQE